MRLCAALVPTRRAFGGLAMLAALALAAAASAQERASLFFTGTTNTGGVRYLGWDAATATGRVELRAPSAMRLANLRVWCVTNTTAPW